MAERIFLTLKWTIDNFSCWNYDIHGIGISINMGRFFKSSDCKVELFPRGISGQEEKLLVRFHGGERCENERLDGEMSYLGSDGSLLCTQELKSLKSRGNIIEIPPGPKFQDVVEQIRKNEPQHKDRLTILFRIDTNGPGNSIFHVHSMIEVLETTLKVNLQFIKDKQLSEAIHVFRYSTNSTTQCMYLSVNVNASDSITIILGLGFDDLKQNIAVHARLFLLNCDGSIVRSKDTEQVLRDCDSRVILDSLKKDEVLENSYMIIKLKFVYCTNLKFLSNDMTDETDAFEILPTEIPQPADGLKKLAPNIPQKAISNHPGSSFEVLSNELMCLFQDQDFTDCQLKCDDVTFPVHRAILVARSPVFKTMLSCDMKESTTGTVDITDIDASTLSRFLTFLYTGAVKELQGEMALKLYYAADKYQVPSLKQECADYLSANVSVSNVCDVLSLAEKHHDDPLTTVSHSFILKNFDEVLSSENWRNFMRREPLLVAETLTRFANRKKFG